MRDVTTSLVAPPEPFLDLVRAAEVVAELGNTLTGGGTEVRHLRQMRSALSSHLLAATVLMEAGASAAAIAPVAQRAAAVLGEFDALRGDGEFASTSSSR
jgi:hypothetical protein